MPGPLPRIDEHVITVGAPPGKVWRALGEVLQKPQGSLARAGARLLGADPGTPVGDPLHEGSALTGFLVAGARPPTELVLEGRHRFSRYALIFRLEGTGEKTLLRAETRAVFPNPVGSVYRALVIGTRLHVVAVRRLLREIRRRAER